MDDMTFGEQLTALREAAESPDETLFAVERVEMFTKLFKHLYKTLAPDDIATHELYQSLVETFLTEWLEGA